MKMLINEFGKLCGVSVRTLHYYDEIGLLKPCFVDEQNNYRFYDEKSLERMQEILFYRELDFPLKSILKIISSPEYDKREAISKQKQLLKLKKHRLERLIGVLEKLENGGDYMYINEFDNSEYENKREEYEREAKEKWGNTNAYKEFSKKKEKQSSEKFDLLTKQLDNIFADFAKCMKSGYSYESENAIILVKRLQDFISDNYYYCTNEILSGLGEMYVSDERFAENINRHGEGNAEFVSRAIKSYCK